MSEWQPIETAPAADFVLVTAKGEMPRVARTYTGNVHGAWIMAEGQGGVVIYQPTHWMPLPEPLK